MKLRDAIKEAETELAAPKTGQTQMVSRRCLIKLVRAARRLEQVAELLFDHDEPRRRKPLGKANANPTSPQT